MFLEMFLAAGLAQALHAGIAILAMRIVKARRRKMESQLEDLYCRAFECVRAGNQEAAEAMAERYRKLCGRKMPPVPVIVEEVDDGP